ncbi:hypothetical protein BD414DRAFT_409771 [Trametes punicea]|nr:hypothetical protein BD414DRAFT_409771 [Trametes punicea]
MAQLGSALDASPSPDIEPDPNFWFDDRSVVLVAQRTAYRVHRSLLARASPVFHDLFTIAHPDTHAFPSGQPVVHVSGSAHDVKGFLHTLYDWRKDLSALASHPAWLADGHPNVPFPVLSALMRLGHKYQIPDMVDDAVRYLEAYLTTDFRTWMTAVHVLSDCMVVDIFETVNLARLTRKPAILPLALYLCCLRPIDAISNGIKRQNGEVVRLSAEHTLRCLRARESLMLEWCQLPSTLRRTQCASQCANKELCAPSLEVLFRCAVHTLAQTARPTVFLNRLQLGRLLRHPALLSLCSLCKQSLFDMIEEQQGKTWERLLEILGLSTTDLDIKWTGYTPL